MPERHKRNLLAWRENYGTAQQSFTPLLGDVIAPVVIVDDQRQLAPIYGARDRLQAWHRIELPIPPTGLQHACMLIKVRGNGMFLRKLAAGANEDLRLLFHNVVLGLTDEANFVPTQIPRPVISGPEDLQESIYSQGGIAPGAVGDHIPRIFYAANPNPINLDIDVPSGQNIYVINHTADAAMTVAFLTEEVARR